MMETSQSFRKIHFEMILDNFDVGVIKIAPMGQITYINQSACEIIGCQDADVTGKIFSEIFKNSPAIIKSIQRFDMNDQHQKQIEQLCLLGEQPVTVKYWLTTKSPNEEGDGGVLFCFQTDMKKTGPGNMLDSPPLEKVVASLIHEIRNPLGGIVGFSNLLEQDLSHLKYAHNMVLKIKQAAESLEKLIGSLAILSQEKPDDKLKPMVFQEYLDHALAAFEKELLQKGLNVEIIKSFPRNDVVVAVDLFSFKILWDIILQHISKVLMDNHKIIFDLKTESNKAVFKVNLFAEENDISLLTNGFRLPEIRQLVIEKIFHKHHGKIQYCEFDDSNTFLCIEFPLSNFDIKNQCNDLNLLD